MCQLLNWFRDNSAPLSKSKLKIYYSPPQSNIIYRLSRDELALYAFSYRVIRVYSVVLSRALLALSSPLVTTLSSHRLDLE